MEDSKLIKLVSGNSQIPLFNNIDPITIQSAILNSKNLSSKKRELLFEQDELADSFYIVKSGLYKLVKNLGDNCTIVHDVITPNEMVGSLLMNTPGIKYPVSLQCILSGEVLAIPRSTFDSVWKNNSQLLLIMQMQSQKRILSIQELRNSSKFSLEKRMAYILKNYLAKLAPENSNILPLNITRNDTAGLVSSTVESVIRVFSKWSSLKITENINNTEIVHLDKLEDYYLRVSS